MNNDRGSMGGCDHTNDNFYDRNGCRACDDDLDDWLAKQEEDKKRAEEEAKREAEKAG